MSTRGSAAGNDGGTAPMPLQAAAQAGALRAHSGSAQLCWCWPWLRASQCREWGVRHQRLQLRQASCNAPSYFPVILRLEPDAVHARPAKLCRSVLLAQRLLLIESGGMPDLRQCCNEHATGDGTER